MTPRKDGVAVDLKELVDELQLRDVAAPVLVLSLIHIYADSEYKTWHAQGMRMWDYKDPWWVQCHGTFENGIAFDVTQEIGRAHV